MNLKPLFTDVAQAKAALAADKLGTVYFRASGVYVVTSFGSGVFKREDWLSGGGADVSMTEPKPAPARGQLVRGPW